MNRIIIAIVVCLILIHRSQAQENKGIHFEQALSWSEIKEMAKTENKYIFVDCFASWCGPCKAMDKDIYTNERIGNLMNEHFLSVKMQMDTSRQDDDLVKRSYGDAHLIMREYKINVYPTFLFFSPDGSIVHRQMGFQNEDGFVAIAKAAMDPDEQYYSLLEKYDHGQLDTAHMKALARICSSFGEEELAGRIANDYIDREREEDLYTSDNIRFIEQFTRTPKDKGFSFFRDHANEIHHAVDAVVTEELKGILEYIIYKQEIKPYIASNNGKPDWDKILLHVRKYNVLGKETYRIYKPMIVFRYKIEPALKKDPGWSKTLSLIKRQHAGKGEEFLVGSSVVYYLNSGLMSGASNNFSNFMSAATYYFKNFYSYLTADPLNSWAWTVFQRSSDKEELSKALVWSDSCLKLTPRPDPAYFDTYANLLYKLGKSNDAISWEEKAVTLAPGDKDIQDNFFKMKNGENTW